MSTPLWALLGSAIWLKLSRRRWWSVQEPAEHWCRWKLVGHRRSTICHTVRISCRYCRCPFWSFCATEPELKLPARQHLEDSQGFSSPQMISSTFKLQESPYFRQGAFRVLRTRNYFISSDPHHGISRHITFWHLYMPLRSGPVPTEIWDPEDGKPLSTRMVHLSRRTGGNLQVGPRSLRPAKQPRLGLNQ